MKSDLGDNHKIVQLEQVRKARSGEDNIIAILKDTKRIAIAIQQRTCALCNNMRMCVNKTGLCAECYLNLSPKEKKIADEEARHKKVELKVTDDRWAGTKDY
ncbi:MAG: hypothetical protein DRG35_04050 [Deltaproteobacteria bacterium]|nr:hypothetical protein [Deltaproteobacteria bacterium]OQY17404.1 MAG: hypothetical protein B6I32_00885 [Desulfobacterium sp. 4572_20]RLJ05238.1 MAG: hypothetical protein DRP14_02225 [Candidatus Aenigmarchaeota archaeon]HDH87342.1 hypothetical protein [Desulfobacteraceae bacterium]MBW2104777.1 hypothetical protein [Deltaproteobacteria bacterium]